LFVGFWDLPGTVADNVAYGPRLQGKRLTDAEIEGYLQQADLDVSFAKKSIIGLSVGQAQRVALARTLANQPEVCILPCPSLSQDSHCLTIIVVCMPLGCSLLESNVL
jgi:ABC-type sulfate/molybdate transport systems ATPase subunit